MSKVLEIKMGWEDFVGYSIERIKSECIPHFPSMVKSDWDLSCDFSKEWAFSIIGWSLYAPFVERWTESFGVARVLVLYYDDLQHDSLKVMRKVEQFLNLGILLSGYSNFSNGSSHIIPDELSSSSELFNSHLRRFFLPSISALDELARNRIISPVPIHWLQEWGLFDADRAQLEEFGRSGPLAHTRKKEMLLTSKNDDLVVRDYSERMEFPSAEKYGDDYNE
jgi:hypothetical protein